MLKLSLIPNICTENRRLRIETPRIFGNKFLVNFFFFIKYLFIFRDFIRCFRLKIKCSYDFDF